MRKVLGLIVSTLLMATMAAAQQPSAAASQKAGSDFGASTIQGCLMGSDTTSTWVLTDEHTGEIYLLHGNDSLLKEAVGQETMLTGTALPIRPSDKKGSIGYISPREPNRTGATSANAGQKALNFEVTHIRKMGMTCGQESESQRAAIAASQAALGSVRSENQAATEPKVGTSAQAPQPTSNQASRPARAAGPPAAITGKTGNKGEAEPVTTTGSAGEVTPGAETQAGKAQAPGRQTNLEQGKASQPPAAKPGAPLNAEQTAQNPAAAERIASSAQRAEINNSEHQLGVNAQPDYRQSAEQQTQEANKPVTGPNYELKRNPRNGTELPGASQHMGTRTQERQQQAEEHQQTRPTLVGCLTRAGRSGQEFFLTEKKSGTRYRLNGPTAELKDHLNHLVEVAGKPGGSEGSSKSVAAGNEAVYEVSGVQDLAPTCGAAR